MLENLEKTLTKTVNNFNNINISKDKKDVQNKISVLFNSHELDSYFKTTYYLDEIENILEELKDLKNKASKTFIYFNELTIRLYKSDFVNQLLTAYFNEKKILRDNQEFYINIKKVIKTDELNLFNEFLNFIINLIESNIKQKKLEFGIEFYSLDNENIFFKLNKNISKLKKNVQYYKIEKRNIKEVDTTLVYTDISKDLFYKIFIQGLSKEKYFSTNGIIINQEKNLFTMFNNKEVFNYYINLNSDNNYIISQDNINFELFNNIFKLLKKDDITSLSVRENIMYLKIKSDQIIKEIKLKPFDLKQNNNDVSIDISNHDRKFLIFNELIQKNNKLDLLNDLISFESLHELKEINTKLNVFNKSYKNGNDFSYNHSINLNIKKRFLTLNINTVETFIYYIKDGTKQEEIRTYKTNKRGKRLDEYTSEFKTVDNIIQKENKKEITENLINIFSSKYNKDFNIDLNLYLNYFIKITDLMIKNNFLNISLSNYLNHLILHDKINYVITAYSKK